MLADVPLGRDATATELFRARTEWEPVLSIFEDLKERSHKCLHHSIVQAGRSVSPGVIYGTPNAYPKPGRKVGLFFSGEGTTCYVYILHLPSLDRFHTGMSTFSDKRERQHPKGQSKWASRADDGVMVWRTEVAETSEVRILKKKTKARGAKRYLQDVGVGGPP